MVDKEKSDVKKIGHLVNNYKLLKVLGEGHFSYVYHAECNITKNTIALKVIKVSNY